MNGKPTDIDGYLSTLPDDARSTLERIRRTIKAVAPEAVEGISYGMPGFKFRGRPLIYFAASKNHCALYGPAVVAHQEELKGYDAAKGTVRFPPGKPLPEDLVRKLVRARMADIDAAEAGRKQKK